MTELKCHVGIGQCVEGEALVARDNFSARYDLDLTKGIFSRPNHDLTGESYVDKVLVFNTAKGEHVVSVAWIAERDEDDGVEGDTPSPETE